MFSGKFWSLKHNRNRKIDFVWNKRFALITSILLLIIKETWVHIHVYALLGQT